MKTVGIICEYNPLHLGHASQMAKLRALLGDDTAIVCVMSGNFVQRGEPAVLDKFTRARAAVLAGADVVLELPVTKTLSSAEGFAFGGVEVLNRLQVVDYLSFGTESGDGEKLLTAAKVTMQEDFDLRLKEKLSTGMRYAAARQEVLAELTGDGDIARTPNDILGLEYCRAILKQNSAMEILPVKREGDYHDTAIDPQNPSATALRGAMDTDTWLDFVPAAAREIFATAPQYRMESGERAVLSRLRSMTEGEWERTAHGSEGLWRKVMKNARTENSVDAIIDASLSKRYPRTRLSRLIMCAYLGITEEMLQEEIAYTRILAFSQQGRKVLRQAKEEGSIPLLTLGEKAPEAHLAERERRIGDLYALFAVEDSHTQPAMEQKARYFI